eukprot:1188919-Prorocentrum_minimum.AAC.1
MKQLGIVLGGGVALLLALGSWFMGLQSENQAGKGPTRPPSPSSDLFCIIPPKNLVLPPFVFFPTRPRSP